MISRITRHSEAGAASRRFAHGAVIPGVGALLAGLLAHGAPVLIVLVLRISLIQFLVQFGVVVAAAGAESGGKECENSAETEDGEFHGRDAHRINNFLEN